RDPPAHPLHWAGPPRLAAKPLARGGAVGLLFDRVLVGRGPFGRAGAADVHPRQDVSVARQVDVVVGGGRVDLVLAVRDVVHDDRQRGFGPEVVLAVVG